MIDARLDSAGVRETLTAIAKNADYLDVVVHAQGTAGTGRYWASIDEAMSALLAGAAIAVRLTYRVDNTAWSATVTRGTSGFRLLRVPRPPNGWAPAGD